MRTSWVKEIRKTSCEPHADGTWLKMVTGRLKDWSKKYKLRVNQVVVRVDGNSCAAKSYDVCGEAQKSQH